MPTLSFSRNDALNIALSPLLLLPAVGAQAQTGLLDTQMVGGGGWLETYGIWILVAILVILLVGGMLAFILSRRPTMGWDGIEPEPEAKRSKYEQLMAEIQGLTLRMSGGESRGYYRKVDQLGRIFLERLGTADARHMSDEELDRLLQSGQIDATIAQTLVTIFERCREASRLDIDKLDMTAAELLKNLRALVVEQDRLAREKQTTANHALAEDR